MEREFSDRAIGDTVCSSPILLSWEETAREMAAANEDWSEWDVTLADGLDELPWDLPRRRRRRR